MQSVQVYVSRLRKLLPEGVLVTRARGYLLRVEADELDVDRFERLRASGEVHKALVLWRGRPLAEFEERFAQVAGARLEDLHLATLEERIEADLAAGGHIELVGELESLIAEHPHRERLRAQLMLALYRAGRQPEALAVYRDARAALDELGIEPGERLRELERGILTQDPRLDGEPAGLLPGDEVPLPGPLVPSSPFPFVGRADELRTLRTLLDRAKEGEGGVALLTGVAGAGKTRLVHEFAHEAAAGGALVLYGTSDATVTTPYQPLREWLEFLLRVGEPDALRHCLGDGVELLARLVPELARLAIPSRHAADNVEADRYLLQSAATEMLTRLTALQPVVLVADDLHWADAATLQLLRRLARIAPEARMLVLAVLRSPGEEISAQLADVLGDFARLDAVTRVALGDLSSDDVRAFIRASTDAEAIPELVSEIGELTNGTPLLLCELWRDLLDTGGVEVLPTVQLSRPFAELRGSEPIRDFMRQRLSRLSAETRALVELAAVAGTQAELGVLGEASGQERSMLVAALDRAAAAGLLEALPEPDLAWRFTHELVRRAVYDRLEGATRAELHLRVGEAFERAYASEPARVLPELAHHFTLAASIAGVERAVDYNVRAATAFAETAAYDLAQARLATALELGIEDRGERASVQRRLAHLLRELGRHDEARPILAASVDALTDLGERGTAALAALERINLMGDPRADPAHVRSIVEDAIETLEALGDPGDLARANHWLGLVLRRRGIWRKRAQSSSARSSTPMPQGISSIAAIASDHSSMCWPMGRNRSTSRSPAARSYAESTVATTHSQQSSPAACPHYSR